MVNSHYNQFSNFRTTKIDRQYLDLVLQVLKLLKQAG
ncbi:hypothetical protein MGE_00655, partial [Candida albicans P75010]